MEDFWWASEIGDELLISTLLTKEHVDVNARDPISGRTPLHHASARGHVAVVDVLLTAQADPNACDTWQQTPLFVSAWHGHFDVVQVLLLHPDVDVHATDRNQRTALYAASCNGHSDIVRLLLQTRVDFNAADTHGITPLNVASSNGHAHVVKMLLQAGANVATADEYGITPLHMASSRSYLNIVQLLLNANADVGARNKDGRLPLHFACKEGIHEVRPLIVRLLLMKGSAANAQDNFGETPLLAAVSDGHTAIVKVLLESGVDINVADKDGNTPLLVATRKYLNDIVELLLQAHVDCNTSDTDGSTPLHLATMKNDSDLAELLLKWNANIEATDKHGNTPLHAASGNNHFEIVERLLEAGADRNALNHDNATPLLVAVYTYNPHMVELLLQKNANPDIPNKNGVTPLHLASERGYLDIVEFLLKSRANVRARDKKGRSPLHHACQYQSTRASTVRLLLEYGSDVHAQDNEQLKPLHLYILKQTESSTTRVGVFAESRGGRRLSFDHTKTGQELVAYGATWDTKCDELIAANQATTVAGALRVCVLEWTQERIDGRIDGQPFTDVPMEIINRGSEAAKTYLTELKQSTYIIVRLKLCIAGPSKAGKTSLITSLTTNEPSLVHPADRTIGVNHSKLRFTEQQNGKIVIYEVTCWDFAGQDQYHVAHSLFYSRRTLYLVCVDLEVFFVSFMQAEFMGHTRTQWERLMNEIIERDILRWIRVIFTRQPDAEFLFVATKNDVHTEFPVFEQEVKSFLKKKLKQVEGIVEEMKRELSKQTCDHERRAETLTLYAYQKRVDEREKRVDEREKRGQEEVAGYTLPEWGGVFAGWGRQLVSSIKGTTTPTEPTHRTVAVEPTVINGEEEEKANVLFVSCADTRSVAEAKQAIIKLIVDSDRSFIMPESFTNVLQEIVGMRQTTSLRGGDARITRMFTRVDALIASLLSKVSNIDHKTCREILQTLHDLGDVLWYEDLGIAVFQKTVILDPLLVIDFVREVINHHHDDELLAHGILKGRPFWINLQTNELILAMKQVLQKFQLVYPSEGKMRWDSDLIVPAFWNSKTPAAWRFLYDDVRLVATVPNSDPNKPKEQVRVHWEYHFAYEFPDTLFDHLVVATHSPFTKRDIGPDWILFAEDGVYACRVMVGRHRKTLERVLHLEAVLSPDANDSQAKELWEAFDSVSVGIVIVLRRYPGLVVESIAHDHEVKTKNLESLFHFPLREQSRTWMPPAASWDLYKQAILNPSTTDDGWILLSSEDT